MIDPTTMLAITAGSTATAGGALLAVIVLASKNRTLRQKFRAEDRERLKWLRSVCADPAPKLTRIPKGQPGAGRYVSTKEPTLAG